jgi:hypothetical protein
MKPGPKDFEEIKDYFEREDGWQIRLHLVNNKFLIGDYIPENTKSTEIGYESNSFEWAEYTFDKLDHDLDDVWKFKTKLVTKGDLISYKNLVEDGRKQITLCLWITIVGRYNQALSNFWFIHDGITIADEKLNIINDFDRVILQEYNELTVLESLNYDLLTKLWPYNDEGNKYHEFISSFDYFNEIENINRQIRYSIAQAKAYSYYTDEYLKEDRVRPFGQLSLAITSHHRRYLDYCTFSIQSIYIFWERLAMLMFQYIQPKKLNAGNLSFFKLIKEIIKEKKAGTMREIDTDWLEGFLENHHSKLQVLRHPLVHYKLSDDGGNGSFLARIHSIWIKNISNKEKLEDMAQENRQLISEIIEQAALCKSGYAQIINLIIEFRKQEG